MLIRIVPTEFPDGGPETGVGSELARVSFAFRRSRRGIPAPSRPYRSESLSDTALPRTKRRGTYLCLLPRAPDGSESRPAPTLARFLGLRRFKVPSALVYALFILVIYSHAALALRQFTLRRSYLKVAAGVPRSPVWPRGRGPRATGPRGSGPARG